MVVLRAVIFQLRAFVNQSPSTTYTTYNWLHALSSLGIGVLNLDALSPAGVGVGPRGAKRSHSIRLFVETFQSQSVYCHKENLLWIKCVIDDKGVQEPEEIEWCSVIYNAS